eukprot:gnl/TRDRNA2_/TRDRNA2_69142_c0_seq1.p1 gnl/TRDRNA2_/TRDRNA2_69142_c0~~gnl/TRDRNA2_/TRDRNA2_69142_c0_seq1.p1  ORF type:complete len:921 (+),score=141.17 gnl/TRDRNA2_/TRDRNA2_69142_c0_seq1:246-3008(+)
MGACSSCFSGLSPQRGAEESGPITLNVGGTRFVTSSQTLLSARSPVINGVLAGKPLSDGSYFLDRDGSNFGHVLNFLRDQPDIFASRTPPSVLKALESEAQSLQIPALADFLAGLAEDKSEKGSDRSTSGPYTGAPIPSNEKERLARLTSLGIMHTNEEHRYDAITRVVSALLNVPIALISLVGDDHQWFKSKCGLAACQTPRETSFCAFTFQPIDPSAAHLVVVEDAQKDPRVKNNPLVLGEPYIRFYAGCPLQTTDGLRLGALCAIDRRPRKMTSKEAQLINNFGQIAIQEIQRKELEDEGSGLSQDLEGPDASLDFSCGMLRSDRMREALSEAVLLVWASPDSMNWPVLYANQAWEELADIRVTPSVTLSQKAGIEKMMSRQLSGMSRQSSNTELTSVWDMLRPTEWTCDQIRSICGVKGGRKPPCVALKAILGPGEMVTCRLAPADQPIDVNASVVKLWPPERPNEQEQVPHWPPGHPYFIFVSRRGGADPVPPPLGQAPPLQDTSTKVPESPKSPPISPSSGRKSASKYETGSSAVSEEPMTARSSGGNTLSSIRSVKPPKPPFSDVRPLKLVGQGSFGTVWFGLWCGWPVAIKVITSEESLDAEGRAPAPSFEAVLSTLISFPYLVQTFNHSSRKKATEVEHGMPGFNRGGDKLAMLKKETNTQVMETWIVQEWCDGGTLTDYCCKRGGLPISEVIDVSIEIAAALSYLHSRGIIHGDLSGTNVLLKSHNCAKGYVCKVCDFGMARVLDGNCQQIMTQSLGTVTHMAPELMSAASPVLTQKADIYSFGVCLWQAVAGRQPFEGLSPPQIVIKVAKGLRLKLPEHAPPELTEIHKMCTSEKPEDRPELEKVHELLSALEKEAPQEGGISFFESQSKGKGKGQNIEYTTTTAGTTGTLPSMTGQSSLGSASSLQSG